MRRRNRFTSVVAMAAAFLMLFSNMAMADNLQDDVVADGNGTFTAGGSTTVNYSINANGADGCNVDAANAATMQVNPPAGLTANPTSLSFTSCGTSKAVVYSTNSPGTYDLAPSISGGKSGNNGWNVNPAKSTLTVLAPSDTTPPVITINTPANGAEYTQGQVVNASFSCTDTASTVTRCQGTVENGSPIDTATLGTQSFRVDASSAGGDSSATHTYTVVLPPDTTAPVLTLPGDITAEATSAAGTVVNYSASAHDDRDGAVAVKCTPASGSTFPLGSTTVNCSAKDAANNDATGSFSVTVRDTTAPTLTVPGNITAEATSAAGASVSFTATARDAVDANPSVTCTPASGSVFGLGTTEVSCEAEDAAGNKSGAKIFSVTVQDTTAPTLWNMPGNQQAVATSASGAVVTYASPTALDAVDASPSVWCLPTSGSMFPIGATTVSCKAKDAAGNESAAHTFTVTVQYSSSKVLQPINEDGSSKFKLNSTIPVKIKLADASAGITDAVITQSVSKLTNNIWGDELEGTSTATPHSGNTLRYDAASDQYIFNLATKPLGTGTFRVTLNLGGGKTETAQFSIVK